MLPVTFAQAQKRVHPKDNLQCGPVALVSCHLVATRHPQWLLELHSTGKH